MRGLEKPSPPSNVSPEGQVPRAFSDAERQYAAALPDRTNKVRFARTAFDALDKAKRREVMYAEQKSLCVYCERSLKEIDPAAHVEHWRPRSRAPEYALHWPNLYLSCSTEDTCGVRKDDRPLRADDADPDLPWPTQLDYEELVGFTSGGEMYVRDDVHMDGATRRALGLAIDDDRQGGRRRRPAILNLNHPTLVAARRAAMDGERTRLGRGLGQGAISTEDRVARADSLLGRDLCPPFVSIRVSWLRRSLGRGR